MEGHILYAVTSKFKGYTLINEDAAVYLSDALINNRRLKKLEIQGLLYRSNDDITAVGWQALFVFLQSPHYVLEYLDLEHGSLDNNAATSLASSLVNNRRLKKLRLCVVSVALPSGGGGHFRLCCGALILC